MNRQRVQTVGVGLLGVLAVTLVASTVPSVAPSPGGSGQAAGDAPHERVIAPTGDGPPRIARWFVFLLAVLTGGVLLRYAYTHRNSARRVGVTVGVGVVVASLAVALLSPLVATTPLPFERMWATRPLASGSAAGSRATNPSTWTGGPLLAVGVVLAAGVALFVLRRVRPRATHTAEANSTERVGAIAETAGDAARRIESGGAVENEVYRAWRQMTNVLEVPNPEASTPGDFADAAVEAGMAAADVRRLTRLFEDVRYGEATPDERTERRARELFERIERTYAGENP